MIDYATLIGLQLLRQSDYEELINEAKNCNNFKYKIINETNHFYVGKEKEVSSLIFEWINDFR